MSRHGYDDVLILAKTIADARQGDPFFRLSQDTAGLQIAEGDFDGMIGDGETLVVSRTGAVEIRDAENNRLDALGAPLVDSGHLGFADALAWMARRCLPVVETTSDQEDAIAAKAQAAVIDAFPDMTAQELEPAIAALISEVLRARPFGAARRRLAEAEAVLALGREAEDRLFEDAQV